MATFVTLGVLFGILVGGAILCRLAGRTRGRTESIATIEAYRIGQDNYTLEYRHCVTTGLYNVFALAHPSDPHGRSIEECGLTRDGQIWMIAEPRSLEHAEAVAFDWMESYSAYIRSDGSTKATITGPAGRKSRKSPQSSSTP
jgi:hypothetical protein